MDNNIDINKTPEAPLTNLQREILKLYKAELSETELLEVTDLLSGYLTKRAIKLADEAWDEQHWDEQKIRELLQTKMRTPYKNIPL